MTFLEQLRLMGVKSAKFDGETVLEVEFFQLEPIEKTLAIVPKSMQGIDSEGPEKCACGHDETAHGGDGLCLLGCSAELCIKSSS